MLKFLVVLILTIVLFILFFFVINYFRKNIFDEAIATDLTSGSVFLVQKPGTYAIWGRTRNRVMSRLSIESPILLDSTGRQILVNRTLMPMSTTGTRYGSTKLYIFEALAGQYSLQVSNVPYYYGVSNVAVNPNANCAPVTYFIKKNNNTFKFFIVVWSMILTMPIFMLIILILANVIPI